MKFGILGLAATAALALSGNSASAQWIATPGYSPYGYSVISPARGHVDYHNGHYHYHDGRYRSGPLLPVYGLDGSVGLAPAIREDQLPGYYPLPSRGSWSSYEYGMPSRGNAYGSCRWRW